jgi:signal peptidase I
MMENKNEITICCSKRVRASAAYPLAQNMNNKTYPKWVGVSLGFILHGSAHFLSGHRLTGIRWYFAILLTSVAGVVFLAVPGLLAYALCIALFLLALVLWLIMLKQSYQPVRRIGVWGWLAILVLAFALNAVWKIAIKQVVRPFKVPTGAMVPAIIPGDHLIAERVSYWFGKPKRGDIVVFNTEGLKHPHVRPDTYYIKRIAGLPGETVQINPPNLIVNGNIVREPHIFAEISSRSNGFSFAHGYGPMQPKPLLTSLEDKIVLGDNQYLTLGDNTTQSLDGRYYGPISDEQICGRISRIYWPLSRVNKLGESQPKPREVRETSSRPSG